MDTKIWNDIIKDINAQLELDACLKTSMEKVSDLLCVERGSLMLMDKETQELSIKASKGLNENIIKSAKTRMGEGVSGWVAKNKEPLLIKDIAIDKRFRRRSKGYHNNSLLSVPLVANNELLGVINVNNKASKETFEENDLDILKEMASHVSGAIDKSLKYEEIKRLSALKLDFVATVSHELRSPLTSVKEAMNLLLDGLTGEVNPTQEKFLTIAKKNIDRVLRLIEELLGLSKLEAGRLDTKRNFQDICAVTKETYETMKIDADKKDIRLKLDTSHKKIEMWFDRDQIQRVFTNLIGNAIKFTQNSGIVKIELEDLGKFVEVSIIDNGPGIAEKDLDKVFDKFYTVGRASSSGTKSTGLGLPITKEIVEAHRGRIWVSSRLGRGSKFSFTLPKDIRMV
ncbi:MAG: GAF domain-containing sensor histidine kinase [Candidatus Omnitrophica bacterium]|nr:GAF domain-containing sensor histidine kinase [Candidatus Omnitrophota bacterium]